MSADHQEPSRLRRGWTRIARFDRHQWSALFSALALLPIVRLSLRHRGFGPTSARLARWSERSARPADAAEVRAITDAVALAALRPVIGTACLGRSLVAWTILRRRGIDAELVVGAHADADTFRAHAWVEYEGAVVNDKHDVRDQYGSFGVALPRLR